MNNWKEQALQLFMAGTSKREISRKLDVPYSSLWEWLDKNVEGKEAVIDDSAHDLFVSDEGIKPRFTTESKVTYGNILLISDMHIPYHHKDTLDFLSDLNKEYVPSRIICMGDELDKHALSFHDSDPELPSAGDELRAALPVISQLHKLFPRMDLLESNHGSLIYRKAKHHGIPRQYLRTYNEVLGVGAGWRWHFDLTVKMENDSSCYFHHGKTNNILRLSQQMGMCAASGHYHNDFAVRYWANPNALYWALQTGCLIDDKSLAFTYNNVNVQRPIIGTSVIVEGLPVLVPMRL